MNAWMLKQQQRGGASLRRELLARLLVSPVHPASSRVDKGRLYEVEDSTDV